MTFALSCAARASTGPAGASMMMSPEMAERAAFSTGCAGVVEAFEGGERGCVGGSAIVAGEAGER